MQTAKLDHIVRQQDPVLRAEVEMLAKGQIAPAIESLNGFYRNARLEHRHRTPAEAGARRLGHFGFFSERHGARLWDESLAWLRGALPKV